MKRCKKCGQVKAFESFYRARGMADGYRSDCKTCNLAAKKARYRKDPQTAIGRVRAWQQANPERHAATQRNVRKRRRAVARDTYLQRTFGITSQEYEELLAAQGGRCRICGGPPRAGSSLHVDHDHVTGCVRGLLCFRCNGGLGQFGEDRDRLLLAADYLVGDLEPRADLLARHQMAIARARGLVQVSG